MTTVQKLDAVFFLFDPMAENRGIHKLQIIDLLRKKNIKISDRLLTEILYKLVKDGNLRIELGEAIIGSNRVSGVEYYLLTLEGEILSKSGGYKKERRKKWITEFPKNNWWLVAIVAFLIGFFVDITKEALKQKILPPSKQSPPATPTFVDTLQNRKNH